MNDTEVAKNIFQQTAEEDVKVQTEMTLEDAETDLREMKMEKWIQKVNNKEQTTAVEMVQVLTDNRIKE